MQPLTNDRGYYVYAAGKNDCLTGEFLGVYTWDQLNGAFDCPVWLKYSPRDKDTTICYPEDFMGECNV